MRNEKRGSENGREWREKKNVVMGVRENVSLEERWSERERMMGESERKALRNL